MESHIYKIVEIVGTSPQSVEDAIQRGIARASQSLRNIGWFQVTETRGVIHEGHVTYQVALKVGFRILSEEELHGD